MIQFTSVITTVNLYIYFKFTTFITMNKGKMYTNVNTEKSPLMAYLPLRLPGRTD